AKESKESPATQTGSGKGTAPGNGSGRAGGAGPESQFGWYGSMLHDRFYSEWVQPTTLATTGSKNSVLVKLRIEKDGRVSRIEIALDPAQGVVVNHMLITQTDDGLTFDVEGLLLKALVLRRGNSAAAIFVALGAEFELHQPIIVLCAQTAYRVRRKIAIVCQALDQTERGFVGFDACFAFFFVGRTIVFDPKLPDQDRQSETLKDQRHENDAEGEKQDVIPARKRLAVRQNKRQRKPSRKRGGAAQA